jgi:hypothetical protein
MQVILLHRDTVPLLSYRVWYGQAGLDQHNSTPAAQQGGWHGQSACTICAVPMVHKAGYVGFSMSDGKKPYSLAPLETHSTCAALHPQHIVQHFTPLR